MAGKQKEYEDLTISDDFMFGKIMRNPENCKEMLERLLDIKIDHVSYPDEQKTIDIAKDSKSVRLDVYVKDEANTIYNVEIQAARKGGLPQRARYYSDMIDLDLLERGAKYLSLNKSFVIFICTFDLFGKDFYQYTFTNICKEDHSISLDDGSTKIFYNTEGHIGNLSKEAIAFLRYIGGQKSDDDFVQRLDDQVKKARENEEWRLEYMTLLMRDQENREEGRQEGLAEGSHEKGVNIAKAMLADGMDCETVAKYTELSIEEVEGLVQVQSV